MKNIVLAAFVTILASSALTAMASESTFLDAETGIEWTQADNGTNIDWDSATTYCKGKGIAWRLPSPDELMGVVDMSQSVPCGQSSSGTMITCHTSQNFRLSSWAFWSNQQNGFLEAWAVSLISGPGRAVPIGNQVGKRALCVHRS